MRWLRRLSWVMTAAAAALLIWTGIGVLATLHNQDVETQKWNQAHANTVVPVGNVLAFRHPPFSQGAQVAKLEIPAMSYVAIMLEGTSDRVLANGPGHMTGSSYPGEAGTMIVSGHNTFMLGLPSLKKGDQVVFTDPDGQFVYVVDGTKIINPSDRLALTTTGRPTLEMTTCWPIWAGALATQRLVIFGHLATS
jgi:LPXTG-site transpeptidase (sortase) family protein